MAVLDTLAVLIVLSAGVRLALYACRDPVAVRVKD